MSDEYTKRRIAGREAAKDTAEMFELHSRDRAYMEAFFETLDRFRWPDQLTKAEHTKAQRTLIELGLILAPTNVHGNRCLDDIPLDTLKSTLSTMARKITEIQEYLDHPGLKEWRMNRGL